VAIIVQQDATVYSLFISANCSTLFGWYLHPSPGARVTVSTVSGITERDWMGTAVAIQSRSRQVAVTVSIMPDIVNTVILDLDDGWRYHPKHVEQFADINKLYSVAYFGQLLTYIVKYILVTSELINTTRRELCISVFFLSGVYFRRFRKRE